MPASRAIRTCLRLRTATAACTPIDVARAYRPSRADGCIAGAVVAWGTLQVHRDGFRAEHAQVVALAAPDSAELVALAHAAAERYGVPLVAYDELDRHAAAHGQPLPASIRPPRRPWLPGWVWKMSSRRDTAGARSAPASDGDHPRTRGSPT